MPVLIFSVRPIVYRTAIIANNNYYLDHTEIFLKEYLQLLYHGLLFLLSVATTEAGHCREYLVNICACCAYRSITKSILYELGGLVCFQVFACDNLIQVVLLTLLYIRFPRLINISISIDACHEVLNEFLLASQLHTRTYRLADIDEYLLVLAVAVVVVLYQKQYVVNVYLNLPYQFCFKYDIIIDHFFIALNSISPLVF